MCLTRMLGPMVSMASLMIGEGITSFGDVEGFVFLIISLRSSRVTGKKKYQISCNSWGTRLSAGNRGVKRQFDVFYFISKNCFNLWGDFGTSPTQKLMEEC